MPPEHVGSPPDRELRGLPPLAGRPVMTMRRTVGALAVVFFATSASAQQMRGTLTSVARYIEVQPMRRDTVEASLTTIDENGRPTFEGRPVFCAAQTCTFYRPSDVQLTVGLNEDLAATAWGFGVEGLSANIYLRGRYSIAGEFSWPRSSDAFDAVLVYAELAREKYVLRGGRQRALSGLGFTSFDGVSATYRARDWLDVELYGGRSLARALEEPRNRALSAVENFIPDNSAWLFGAAADVDLSNGTVASFRYQREIWSDRAALISERAAVDIQHDLWGYAHLDAAADYDVAFNRLGKAHATLRKPLLNNRLNVDVTARRYLPFFELWTIWGAFSPVPYHEIEFEAGWRASAQIDFDARVGFRRYDNTEAAVFIAPAADESRRLAVRARVRVNERLAADAEYQLESGFGAYLSSGEAALRWSQSDRLGVGLYTTAFQQILEFRTGEAAVFGVGGEVDVRLSSSLELNASASVYHQAFQNRPSAVNWNQKRAMLGITWSFGRDPGMTQ